MLLSDIKGIGAKRLTALNKCGIFSPIDLIMIFPFRYYDRRLPLDFYSADDEETVVFEATVVEKPSVRYVRRNLSMVKAKLESNGAQFVCTWFNQNYVVRSLAAGSTKIIMGKIKRFRSTFEIANPQIIPDSDRDIIPIYKVPKGLSQSVMADAAAYVCKNIAVNGYIDKDTANEYGLLPLKQAFLCVHLPQNVEDANMAKKSIAIEQLSYTLSVYRRSKNSLNNCRKVRYLDNTAAISTAINELPYKLTTDQSAAINEILAAFSLNNKMNILLQGDVGSGKTIVAFLSMLYVAMSGYQCVIMAPTEILAKQHYRNAVEFFEPKGIKTVCVLGSQTKADRTSALNEISSGSAKIIVGTHAVIEKNVIFNNLAFTVIDEQHRFGVCQRGALENKSEYVDNLVMSATPIPRTLALTLYGELKSVVLAQKPIKTNNVKTALVPQSKLQAMYEYIKEKAKNNEKTFIVCPRVDSENELSAVSLYNTLKTNVFSDLSIGLLHGQMKESEKSKKMNEFAFGDTSVLVCTTVIEVGVDVKNATTMVIFGADRYGLSQLHQLRGRIGRDGKQSYCFLVGESCDRLNMICECNDGFKLAEYDFDSRGAGDFLGEHQHGDGSVFAGIKVDAEMIKTAKAISDKLLISKSFSEILSSVSEKNGEFIKSLSLN